VNPADVASQRRRDLQIVRGLAVFGVMLAHFGTLIPGGFLGVDVFFVVSGFVITRSLFRLRQKFPRRRTLLRAFWMARARRLIPALLVVIPATLAMALFLLRPDDFREQVEMSVWSLFFAANIGAEVQFSAGYFDPQAKDNWFLHLWSLGVEEQFYLAFPFLFLFLLFLSKGKPHRPIALWGLVALSALSLGGALVDDVLTWVQQTPLLQTVPGLEPALGYYSPVSRGWQLLAGVIAALLIDRPGFRPRWRLGALGVLVVVGSMVVLPGSNLYPGPLTVIPTLGAFLIVLHPLPETLAGSRWLGPLKWLGDRSYSAYLWHWPLWLALEYLVADSTIRIALAIGITLLLAHLTYRFVETPFMGVQDAPADTPPQASPPPPPKRPLRWHGVTGAIVGYSAIAFIPIAIDEAFDEWEVIPDPPGFSQVAAGDNCIVTECASVNSVLIVGDSHAGVIAGGLGQRLETIGIASSSAILEGCPHLLSTTIVSANPDCQEQTAAARALIIEEPPEVVILHGYTAGHFSSTFSGRNQGILLVNRLDNSSVSPANAGAAYQVALEETIRFLTAKGIEVVIVSGVPDFSLPPQEALLDNRPLSQVEYLFTPWLELEFGQRLSRADFLARNGIFREIEAELAAVYPGVVVVDPWDSVCGEQLCRQIQPDGRFVYSDWDHLSPGGASPLIDSIMRTLDSEGVLARIE